MWSTLRISRYFSLTSSLYARTAKRKLNPGLGHHVITFEDAPEALQADPEGFGDMETDFSNVHKAHKDYEREVIQQRDKIRQFVVKSKYFPSDKLPNFLTIAEKEQIRILHNKDSEQWSVDVLAESFPANCDIIRKVIKANWKSSSLKRIQQHDKAVSRNWQLFEKGELKQQLPKELQEHLSKFANRRQLGETSDMPTRIESTPISKEFSSLLMIGEKQAGSKNSAKAASKPEKPKLNIHNEEDTYLLDKIRDKKNIRLSELKESKLKSKFGAIDMKPDLELAVNSSEPNRTGPSQDLSVSFREKFVTSEVVIGEDDKKRYEMTTVKDRIYIPRKLRRKGSTYRVDDCYYDDDGEFLYRVPGMTAG